MLTKQHSQVNTLDSLKDKNLTKKLTKLTLLNGSVVLLNNLLFTNNKSMAFAAILFYLKTNTKNYFRNNFISEVNDSSFKTNLFINMQIYRFFLNNKFTWF